MKICVPPLSTLHSDSNSNSHLIPRRHLYAPSLLLLQMLLFNEFNILSATIARYFLLTKMRPVHMKNHVPNLRGLVAGFATS